ncbi:hypothetical protein HK100_004585 [Physocladia obscura]|uniref:DAGKc domain-containing protein n=1 Tax=Physocladia obscura TaxID=109957 RepID=A0AAD5XJ18_9FUNG|nr:hypothetical protein HK100_004585 [Physocladia obscura]
MTQTVESSPILPLSAPVAVSIIVNSLHAAASKEPIALFVAALNQLATTTVASVTVTWTSHAGHARSLARAAIANPDPNTSTNTVESVIVAVGGDGTIHEVLNGIIARSQESNQSRPSNVTLAIIPTGSGNALATTLGFISVEQALRLWTSVDSKTFSQDSRTFVPDSASSTIIDTITGEQRENEVRLIYEGKLGTSYFVSSKVTHFEKGFHISPSADPSSRQTDLIYTTTKLRKNVQEMLGKASGDASHLLLPFVTAQKARAFVFESVSDSEGDSNSRVNIVAGFLKRWVFWWWKPSVSAADVCVDGEMYRIPSGMACWIRDLDDDTQIFHIVIPPSATSS